MAKPPALPPGQFFTENTTPFATETPYNASTDPSTNPAATTATTPRQGGQRSRPERGYGWSGWHPTPSAQSRIASKLMR